MQARLPADSEMAQVSDQEASASVDDSFSDQTSIPPALLYEEVRSITSALHATCEDTSEQEWTAVPSKHGSSRSQPQQHAEGAGQRAVSTSMKGSGNDDASVAGASKADAENKEVRRNVGRGRGRGRGRGQGMHGNTGRGRGRGRGRSNVRSTDTTAGVTAVASNSAPDVASMELAGGNDTTKGPANVPEKRRNAGRGRHARRRSNGQHVIPGHVDERRPTEKSISVQELFSH